MGSNYRERLQRELAGWLEDGQGPVVAAVSGGVDSMVLLDGLRRAAAKVGRPVMAVHVHHGLRAAADADLELVQRTCADWGVACRVRRVQVGQTPKGENRGVEANARRLRYQALAAVAREAGAGQVFLAHHADDQLETILWRLLRGTSLTGIGGMRARSVREGMEWLRPLLKFEKAWLYAYAAVEKVPFREDESNQATDYTRNYLRHQVLPRLRDLEPKAAQMAVRFSEVVQEEDAWLEEQAWAGLRQCVQMEPGQAVVDLPRFLALARPLQRRIVKILLYCLASGDWTLSHIAAVLSLAESARPSGCATLGMGLSAWREYDRLYVGLVTQGHGDRDLTEQPAAQTWRLFDGARWEHRGAGCAWRFVCRAWTPALGLKTSSAWETRLPPLARVTVRTARAGDRARLLGRSGSRKLQDVFVDSKVPRRLRGVWPVVCVEDEIVWVPGLMRAGCSLLEPGQAAGWAVTCVGPNPACLRGRPAASDRPLTGK
ncbi:tRNA lysidine(34) synthetase TilS [Alicyclobacillus kakegawensis]|uniref:tRNA lysidine(34) synthetase TilS n=1 Tax=Alicyclobacillus kakegawensis TaxID=392012 RepID=UPI00082D3EF1|nr:tRNA lysidine(34) synthetase TilS [Alicyclobacillus kakegawensis]